MSRIFQEIEKCMSRLTQDSEGKITARFVFPPEFIGFKGHFPNQPVLPGVCNIQAVTAIFKTLKKREVRLREIVLAKFFTPVSPNQELFFACRNTKEKKDQSLIKVLVVNDDGKKIAELQLKLSFRNPLAAKK
jgi:3-hydroxyacyl-[acyl-carrier-protein] dehydratase